MIVYHGSTIHVQAPEILEASRMLDFGKGFYTTTNKEQADRWAEIVAEKQKRKSRFITEYKFDFESACNDLTIISFTKPDESWLEFVCANRSGRIVDGTYDIAIGPVADDQVYTVVLLYEQGVLSKEAAIMELKVRELYNQILFHTEKSLDYLRYIRHYVVGGTENGAE
jgi:hypothetical protein